MSSRHLYEFGPFRLDVAEQRLLRDGEPVALTPKVFETLVALVERRGHLVGKDELMKAVWADAFVEESNLTNNVYTLRKLLGETDHGGSYIETVPKRGYRFVASVRPVSPEALVVERRTVTRIVTEVNEEDAPPAIVVPAGGRRPAAKLLHRTAGVMALSTVVAIAGYRLFVERPASGTATPAVPLGTIDVSRVTTSGNVTHTAVSADGQYVASVVRDALGNSLWVKHQAAPSNVRIAGPEQTEYISVTFAPDLKSIYFVTLDHDKGESTLYRVPVLGGSPELVAPDILPVGLSPDGRQIAFIRMRGSESAVFVANADGSNQRMVAARQKPDLFELEWNAPAWSPDGRTLAAPVRLSDERGRYATVIGIEVASGRQAPLTTHRWSYAAQAAWLPDGSGLLVSASEATSSPMQVWHIQIADGAATQVTRDLNNYSDLSLTRDGSRLVAVQTHAVSNIWVADQSGGHAPQQIRSEVGTLSSIAWTPDGRIVYRSSGGGRGPDLWTMKADGSNARQLTIGARVAQGLAASPDGRHVVFSSDATNRSQLWRVDTDGGNLRQLTDGTGEFFPEVTPDGQWVVYQSDLSIDPRLWKVPIDGGKAVQLTTTRAAKPAISPDGRMIAYSYLDIDLTPSRWGVGVISIDGEPRRTRFDFPPTVVSRYVRWSPDGRSIAFVNSPNGVSDVWLQPLDGRQARRLTSFRAEQIPAFAWSADGRSLALVRELETSDAVMVRFGRRFLP